MYTSVYKYVCEIMPQITTHGRVKVGTDGELRLSWSASGLTFTFKGEAFAVELMPYVTSVLPIPNRDQLYATLRVEVDGARSYSTVAAEGSSVYANNLSDGIHTVTILKETESDEPLRVKGIRIYGNDAEFLPSPKKSVSFKMEVIGDSITCGYGIWGTEPAFITYQESATSTYAYLCAEELGADVRLISWSGRGIAMDYCGVRSNRFIDFFKTAERANFEAAHDFSLWQPDVLVINGGTNDAGLGHATAEDIITGARELYDFVRSVYPECTVLFFYGSMGDVYDGAYRSLVDELSVTDPKVHYTHVKPIDASLGEVGANGHPSAAGQKRIGKDLTQALKGLGFGASVPAR